MKITSVTSVIVDAVRTNYVFAIVDTDEGLRGVGEGTVETREKSVSVAIEENARYLVGQDPFQIERHVATIHRDSYWRGGVILRSALAAVEAALLDIKAQALGVPVYELLGGAFRERIPVYANGWFAGARTTDEFVSCATKTVAAGFRALKWDPFGDCYAEITKAKLVEIAEHIGAIRDAVGSNVDLMIEGHGRFNLPSALRVADMLAAFEPKWFEEPLPPESIIAYRNLCERSAVPIATGERLCEPARFHDLLEFASISYIQPDVVHIGGLSEFKKVVAAANARFCPTSPHNPAGPVANAMTVHAAAASEGVVVLETMVSDVPWRSEIANESVQIINGELVVPKTIGLGITLDLEQCKRHPYQPHELRHYNQDLTNIRPHDAKQFFQTE